MRQKRELINVPSASRRLAPFRALHRSSSHHTTLFILGRHLIHSKVSSKELSNRFDPVPNIPYTCARVGIQLIDPRLLQFAPKFDEQVGRSDGVVLRSERRRGWVEQGDLADDCAMDFESEDEFPERSKLLDMESLALARSGLIRKRMRRREQGLV
jgi:hypothetical protein